MCIDDPTEGVVSALASAGFYEQIFILREEYAPQCSGAFQQQIVWKLIGPVFMGGQHVEAALSQPGGYGAWDMLIHVQGKRHQRCGSLFS